MVSPTQLSLKLLRNNGYLADVVERYNSFSRKRHDLYGIFDIVACRTGEIAFIQTTTASNVSARIHKIEDHPDIDIIRKSGATLLVHGWRKLKGRWSVRVVDVS